MTDAEAVPLFRTFFAASGTYKIEGSLITLTYDSSLNQLWTGTSQKRKIEIVGNKLTVTSDPFKSDTTGLGCPSVDFRGLSGFTIGVGMKGHRGSRGPR